MSDELVSGQVQTLTPSLVCGRYLPGSIVRVKLLNFVTYDAVEFSPGPHLNMIVGPNGTGKSTIVCAIALGLGWTPQVLGRAKDVASYVKQGQEEGRIELELKSAKADHANLIIERHLARSDNSSVWLLNRRKASAKDVKRAVDSLGIDVGNLCCFLPQDRVAEFASMDPPELLRQTQKAAGRAGMSDWHERLIELGGDQGRLNKQITDQRAIADNLEDRLLYLERDVQRAEERHRMEVTVATLTILVMHAQYRERKSLYDELKREKEQSQRMLKQLKSRLQPLSDKLNGMEKDEATQRSEFAQISRAVQNEEKIFKKNVEMLERFEAESQKFSEQLDSVRMREKETKRVINQLRQTIAQLQEKIRDEPGRPDTRTLDTRIRSIRDDMRSLYADAEEARVEQNEIAVEVKGLDGETDTVRRRLAELDSVKHARLALLQRADQDTYRAVLWLREHSVLFKEKVYEPVMLEVSIRDPAMAAAVEGCINFPTMKTFVCQNQEDYDTFGRTMDNLGLRVNFCDRGRVKHLDAFQRPTTQDELEAMGFDRYIIDLIDGPDIILRYLCNDSHLHTIPVTADERSVDVQAVETSNRFQRYITGRHQHTIAHSNYGSRQAQTLTRNLRPARTFNQSIDQNLRNELDAQIQKINERKAAAELRMRKLADEKQGRDRRVDQLRADVDALEQKKGDMLRTYQAWEKAKVDLRSKQAALQEEERRPSAEAESRRLRKDLEQVHDKCVKILDEMQSLMASQLEKRSELDVKQLALLHCHQKMNALRRLKDQQEGQFNDARTALEHIDMKFKQAKEAASSLLRNTRDAMDGATDEVREQFRELEKEGGSSHELQERLNNEEAKLALAINVQPGVLDEYKRRKNSIHEIEREIRKLSQQKDKVDREIDKLRGRWLPALKELVDDVDRKFSRAFRAIGNAGEVRISENEDYEKWGIDILVKFRNEEQLQQLNAQRQSGGERSISTITYLLSLTEMSRAPFSLVDEINQGMDQKYERQVHDHMVKVTCSDTAGQ